MQPRTHDSHRATNAVLDDVSSSIEKTLQEDGTITTPVLEQVTGAASAAASATAPSKQFATIKEGVVDSTNIRVVAPHVICQFPDKYLSLFLEYHRGKLPDMSEGKKYVPEDLRYWRGTGALSSGLSAHKELPGLCAKWVNLSLDFTMARFLKYTFAF